MKKRSNEPHASDRVTTRRRALNAGVAVYAAATILCHAEFASAQGATPAPAPAQQPAAAPKDNAPKAVYGDWSLRCAPATATVKGCELTQDVLSNTKMTIARFALGSAPGTTGPLRITVIAPPNVSFPSTVRMLSDDNDQKPLQVNWVRCMPGACAAASEIGDDVLKRWRSLTNPGRVVILDAGGKTVSLPISFRGLGPALDALRTNP